jgi:RimJ/RimL family protein N-acetyltransferase
MPYLVDPVVDPASLAGQQPTIAAGALRLRRWAARDAAQLKTAFADPGIQQWNLRRIDSLEEAGRLILGWKYSWRRHVEASWAVVRAAEPDVVIGQVGLRSMYLIDGMAEVSYWVIPQLRRQGLATEATRILATWAIEDIGFHRLELVHSVANPGSCRVALRADFQKEGVKRGLQRHMDGWHDMCLHARVNVNTAAVADPTPLRVRIVARLERSLRTGDAGGRTLALASTRR